MHRRTWGTSLLFGLLILLSLWPAPAQSVSSGSTARAVTVSPPTKFEADILVHINNRRSSIGCPKLAYRSTLAYAARQHTNRMVAANQLSHQLYREPSLGTRVTAAGYTPWRMLAENLAKGTTTPWATYTLWMGSAGHRANIENCTLRDAGLGAAWVDGRSWVTLDFGRQ